LGDSALRDLPRFADIDGMAAPVILDYDELLLRAVKLQREEAVLERRLAKAEDRNSAFPNEMSQRRVNALASELALTRAASDWIRTQFVPVMRTAD
jgi:hypothetical protein